MKNSRRIVRPVRSPLAQFCVLEPLEIRQLLALTVPNILPLGDSITEAFTGHASYRYWLWNALADAGHTVDFVGSHQPAGVANGPPLFPGFDPNHDGYAAFRANDLQVGLETTAWKDFAVQPINTPDIALLHVGTNDVTLGESDATTRDEIGKIIDALRVVNPNVTVLLAQIIPTANVSVAGLNSLLPALATSKNTAQSRVILVDQATGFNLATDTYDGIHPNEVGEKKIAAKWLAALTPLLPAPTPPPEGVYLDSTAVPLTGVTNGLGPIGHETSNGGVDTYDGQMLSLRGKEYMRGFGVHAPSTLTFDLSGATYTRFRATLGVDDEVNPNGTVVFQVYVNNEATPRFSSQTLNGLSAALAVDVDITGATSLRLVATDAGDGADFDHADWALARLIPAAPEPPPPPPPDGEGEGETDVPCMPKRLVAKYNGNDKRVDLSWKDTSDNELGFRIFRKERGVGKSGWQPIATLDANATSFADTNLTGGAKYSYRVVAFNDEGLSHHSNTANANVPPKLKKGKKDKPKNDPPAQNGNQGQNDQNQRKAALKALVQRVVEAIKDLLRRR